MACALGFDRSERHFAQTNLTWQNQLGQRIRIAHNHSLHDLLDTAKLVVRSPNPEDRFASRVEDGLPRIIRAVEAMLPHWGTSMPIIRLLD